VEVSQDRQQVATVLNVLQQACTLLVLPQHEKLKAACQRTVVAPHKRELARPHRHGRLVAPAPLAGAEAMEFVQMRVMNAG